MVKGGLGRTDRKGSNRCIRGTSGGDVFSGCSEGDRWMDVKYIKPFLQSIRNVFQTMLSAEVALGKPTVMKSKLEPADVSGIIGFSGDATGCVVLSFPKHVAIKSASAFAGMELEAGSPDFADAIGELANMVAGNAKKDLDGLDVSISLPSVIIGRDHEVMASHSSPRIMIPCSCEFGSFYVEVGMVVERIPAGASREG